MHIDTTIVFYLPTNAQ